jgi:hypothetical protein
MRLGRIDRNAYNVIGSKKLARDFRENQVSAFASRSSNARSGTVPARIVSEAYEMMRH